MISQWLDAYVRRRHPLKSRTKIKEEVEAKHDQVGHAVAQRFSRGNVRIKGGAFLTREDLAEREKARSR